MKNLALGARHICACVTSDNNIRIEGKGQKKMEEFYLPHLDDCITDCSDYGPTRKMSPALDVPLEEL